MSVKINKLHSSRHLFCEAKEMRELFSFIFKRQFTVLFVDDDGAARGDRSCQDLLREAVLDHLADDAL